MNKKLRRSRSDRKIGGVFGGLSDYLGVDATVLRIIYVVLIIISWKTMIGVIAYIIALFIIPSENASYDDVIDRHNQKMKDKYDRHERKMQSKSERVKQAQAMHSERAKEMQQRHLDRAREMRERHSNRHHNRHHNHTNVEGVRGRQAQSTPRPKPIREFEFNNTTFRTMELKIATGDIIIRAWDKEDVKMRTVLSVHNKARAIQQLSEEKLWDYFFTQTTLDMSGDRFVFESKNDALKTDVVLTIPKRAYEQVRIQLLNGNLKYDDMEVDDSTLKVRHGDIRSTGTAGKFLVASTEDGEILFKSGRVENIELRTTKGDVSVTGDFQTTVAVAENGDVGYNLQNDQATAADLKAPHGDIRIQIPATWKVDGTLGTKREKIYFDLKNAKVWDESNKSLVFTQNSEEMSVATLQASVDNGIIKITELEEKQG
ncbi:PspC domain-containing protein [Listeria grandensis]|uniref:PspC domain-containing protein n=1 Tax=Listeria grandensis TaxID=1494963 RepID=A0A7X0Y4I8_9LIST|nr:PspC domain-containing protein [Listeria grandensis]MBC1474993.1 PspC domain-containing protein [Listeria grandensis]MBC1936867.1 PspC domain-containing protein [Listeria grandensis]